jgi:hypothetical protein
LYDLIDGGFAEVVEVDTLMSFLVLVYVEPALLDQGQAVAFGRMLDHAVRAGLHSLLLCQTGVVERKVPEGPSSGTRFKAIK